MNEMYRNRIKGHRKVRAGDLVPHEWNWRVHPEGQRAALEALYRQVGCARSLLVYETADGRLKLIDGHLRRDLDPDSEVEVEILDVDEEEARILLLSIDPLASLAQAQEQIRERLRELAPAVPEEVQAAWRAAAEASVPQERGGGSWGKGEVAEEYYVLITCRDEAQQVELLGRFQGEGLECRGVMS